MDGGAVTVVGLALSGWIVLNRPSATDDFLSRLYLAAAALIGTIVVLAVNLSLIPLQRAAEQYSPSLLRIFREDRITSALIIALASISVLLFALGIPGIVTVRAGVRHTVPVFVVAIALDLLRWHHRRMTRLLEPFEALSRLQARAVRLIDRHQNRVARLARSLYRALPQEQRLKSSTQAVESRIYVADRSHITLLTHWLDDLAEATVKAQRRGDDLASLHGITALTQVARRYLERRNGNLVLTLAVSDVFRSDVFDLLEPVLEHLKQVVVRAASDKRERLATAAITSLAQLTASTAALNGKPLEERSGALTWVPLAYLIDSMKLAQKEGLIDSAFRGSRELVDVAIGMPPSARVVEAHLAIVAALRDVAFGFLTAGQGAVAKECVKHLLLLNSALLERDYWQLAECLAESLRALKALAPVVFGLERGEAFGLTWLPIAAAYDLAERNSLPYFLEGAASQIPADGPERQRRRAYARFTRFSESISRHFRELAETPGCGASSLIWHIGRSVGYVAGIHRTLIAKATPERTDDPSLQSELAKLVSSHVACLWVAFRKTPPANAQWADDVVEEIAAIGMHFCDTDFTDVVDNCGSAIRSIVESCAGTVRSHHDIADLLMGIWKLRIYAELKGRDQIVRELDKRLGRLPEIKEDQWQFVEDALALRKKQFEKGLTEGDWVWLSMSEPARLIFQARHEAKVPPESPGATTESDH